MYSIDDVAKTDKDIADLIEAELARQNSHIELIASENWVSKAVMAAMGSPLTNKYAEGYPVSYTHLLIPLLRQQNPIIFPLLLCADVVSRLPPL